MYASAFLRRTFSGKDFSEITFLIQLVLEASRESLCFLKKKTDENSVSVQYSAKQKLSY